jgi:hypothetical protein
MIYTIFFVAAEGIQSTGQLTTIPPKTLSPRLMNDTQQAYKKHPGSASIVSTDMFLHKVI